MNLQYGLFLVIFHRFLDNLISKQNNLKSVYAALKKVNAVEVRTIPMGQGNKSSRIVAWSFFAPKEKKEWIDARWK